MNEACRMEFSNKFIPHGIRNLINGILVIYTVQSKIIEKDRFLGWSNFLNEYRGALELLKQSVLKS